MKEITLTILTSTLGLFTPLNAEDAMLKNSDTSSPNAIPSKLIDFSFNMRARYEFREQEMLDPSHALTIRSRPGITVSPTESLSLFIESEHTMAIIDDYNSGPQPQLNPYDPSNTSILDPETNELNQLYAKYHYGDFSSTLGRQRLIFDQAAFIGNVGWRQNEQTLDAAALSYQNKNFEFSYAFANRVNRIFGSEAIGFAEKIEGSFHILNGSKDFGALNVGAYGYFFDTDDIDPNIANFRNASATNTVGIFASYNGLYGEMALQSDTGDSTIDNDSSYLHVTMSKQFETFSYKAGIEWLEDGFVTPLATVHAFNGFADVFIGNRLGLVNSWEGLTDIYAMIGTQIGDINLKGFVHHFSDDSMDQNYGWELDLVAVKPIYDNSKFIAKAAFFFGEEGTPFANDVSQVSLQIDYAF